MIQKRATSTTRKTTRTGTAKKSTAAKRSVRSTRKTSRGLIF